MEERKVAILVRIRPSLKSRLVEVAKREHRSLNQQIEFLLDHAVSNPKESRNNEQTTTPGERRKH